MAKMTLLDIVQDILYAMGSDNVNSISDTYESTQVAHVVKNTFYDIANRKQWKHLGTLEQLTASGDEDFPTYMSLPSGIQSIEFIKYNKKTSVSAKDSFEEVYYMSPKEFIDVLDSRDSTATNVEVITDPTGVELLIRNDLHPSAWTSFDDNTIVFDSYYSSVDDTLQSSKTKVFCFKEPSFSLTDTHVPDLPAEVFPYLLAESKSTCFIEVAQEYNQKEEQRSKRMRNESMLNGWAAKGGIMFKDYGRKR